MVVMKTKIYWEPVDEKQKLVEYRKKVRKVEKSFLTMIK